MSFEEFENSLASGFHDGAIHSLIVDYEAAKLTMDCSVWMFSDELQTDEVLRRVKVTMSGLYFCVIEPPNARSLARSESLEVSDFKPEDVLARDSGVEFALKSDLLNAIPSGAFARSFFVSGWNSFIHIAAQEISMEVLKEAAK